MEYFVFANSFAAPFVSDSSEGFIEGTDAEMPRDVLAKFIKNYKHPAGLYFAALYASATDYHKDRDPLVKWTCNHQLRLKELSDKGACMFRVQKPGVIEVDGKVVTVANPKDGEFSADVA